MITSQMHNCRRQVALGRLRTAMVAEGPAEVRRWAEPLGMEAEPIVERVRDLADEYSMVAVRPTVPDLDSDGRMEIPAMSIPEAFVVAAACGADGADYPPTNPLALLRALFVVVKVAGVRSQEAKDLAQWLRAVL